MTDTIEITCAYGALAGLMFKSAPSGVSLLSNSDGSKLYFYRATPGDPRSVFTSHLIR